ncbi:MAG: hypothetical protein ACC641_04085 [Acidiferrobacterales bacterium]
MNNYCRLLLITISLFIAGIANAGALDMLRAAKQASDAKDAYDLYKTVRAVEGMENAEAIFSKIKRIYIRADLKPEKGDVIRMNQLVEKVLCDNVDRIVDNLEDYDMEGATPKCKTGASKKPGKKKVILMTVTQESTEDGISTTVQYVDQVSNKTLKTFTTDTVDNYLTTVEKIVDDLHGDLVISSRTNNPYSLKKWPKRFKKYNKKKKHRKVEMKRKERKQLAVNLAN